MSKRKEVCDTCGSPDIRQEVTFMIKPNDPKHDIDWNDAIYQDYYHCMVCKDECDVEFQDEWTKELDLEYPSGESNCQYGDKG